MEEKSLSWQRFRELAATCDFVAFATPLSWDHESTMSLADRFANTETFFLLESAFTGTGQMARYSFLGYGTQWVWSLEDEQITTGLQKETQTVSLPQGANPLKLMYDAFSFLRVSFLAPHDFKDPDLAALCGAVGYVGYDVAAKLEPRIGLPPPRRLGLPAMHYLLPDVYLILDHLTHTLYVVHYCHVGGQNQDQLLLSYEVGLRDFESLLCKLQSRHVAAPLERVHQPLVYENFTASVSKEQFLQNAAFCHEQIRAGEIFQIQIGNRLSCPVQASPFAIFRHLRMLNPSPYMFFFKIGGHHILGASPEMMLNLTGRCLTQRPIAGTRKRSWNQAKDELVKAELLSSVKEQAEHVMLVDLTRNDLGRMAETGSVKVRDLLMIEEYSHVFHLVSEVGALLAPSFSAATALSTCFPHGTVSGAPKIRAMELIYQLEPCAREFYAGSLGLFTFNGNLKSTILIRSIHIKDQVAATQASAGIVYDSVPEHEWRETQHKMAACLTAMANTRS